MSTQAQIEANRKNAQHSTGATTPEGQKASSLNAIQHGFTAQKVYVTDEQAPIYEKHCAGYMKQYQPKTHEETDLIQQYIDQHWTLHQISVQEMNVLTLMNMVTDQHMKAGSDVDTINAATAPYYKQLRTLSIYEQRRRRASELTLAKFKELKELREKRLSMAASAYKAMAMQNKPFNPEEFGFVCSVPEVETYVLQEMATAELLNYMKANRK